MGKVIVRNATKEDMLFFALPAAVVYIAGLVVSAWHLVRQQGRLPKTGWLNRMDTNRSDP